MFISVKYNKDTPIAVILTQVEIEDMIFIPDNSFCKNANVTVEHPFLITMLNGHGLVIMIIQSTIL